MIVLGVDPGKQGAFVVLSGRTMDWLVMPLIFNELDFEHLCEKIKPFSNVDHIFLERAIPMAMGSKHAFNYGRDFAKLELALATLKKPITQILPNEWPKIMHQGIDSDYKPKTKSRMAVEKLFPDLLPEIPTNRNKKLHDGVLDALLIAEYGKRVLGGIHAKTKVA